MEFHWDQRVELYQAIQLEIQLDIQLDLLKYLNMVVLKAHHLEISCCWLFWFSKGFKYDRLEECFFKLVSAKYLYMKGLMYYHKVLNSDLVENCNR